MGILIFIFLTVCLAMADFLVKTAVEGGMTKEEERTACGGNIILRKVYNKGFCLNLMENDTETVKYVSAYATVLLTIYQLLTLLLSKGRWLKKTGLSLVTAGAWSNTLDRWIRGYVIDYASVKTKWEKVTRIVFNLGDVLIVVGSVLLVLTSLFHKKKKK